MKRCVCTRMRRCQYCAQRRSAVMMKTLSMMTVMTPPQRKGANAGRSPRNSAMKPGGMPLSRESSAGCPSSDASSMDHVAAVPTRGESTHPIGVATGFTKRFARSLQMKKGNQRIGSPI